MVPQVVVRRSRRRIRPRANPGPPLQIWSAPRSIRLHSRLHIPGPTDRPPPFASSDPTRCVQLRWRRRAATPCKYGRHRRSIPRAIVSARQRPSTPVADCPAVVVSARGRAGDLRAHLGRPFAKMILTHPSSLRTTIGQRACPRSRPRPRRSTVPNCGVARSRRARRGAPTHTEFAQIHPTGQFCLQSRFRRSVRSFRSSDPRWRSCRRRCADGRVACTHAVAGPPAGQFVSAFERSANSLCNSPAVWSPPSVAHVRALHTGDKPTQRCRRRSIRLDNHCHTRSSRRSRPRSFRSSVSRGRLAGRRADGGIALQMWSARMSPGCGHTGPQSSVPSAAVPMVPQ